MIIATRTGESFDTEKDLSDGERHVLQKLMIWQEFVASVEDFRQKKQQALQAGWSDSGPLRESPALKSIIKDLEANVVQRLCGKSG